MKNSAETRDALVDPLAGLLGYQLRRASSLMASDLSCRLEALGLTVSSLAVLLMIDANPGASPGEISRALGVKTANLAPRVAGLAGRDLLERSPTDGRSHGLRLTPAGRDLIGRAWACVRANEARFSSCLPPTEHLTLTQTLGLLRQEAAPTAPEAS